MSSDTGLCFIAKLPFFHRILYKLSLHDIYNLMAVSSSLYHSVSQTNLYRILAEDDDEPHTGFIKPFIMIQDVVVRRWGSKPYVKLMINAGYIRDVDLIEYSIRKYQLANPKDMEYVVYTLRRSVAASILIGGFDDSTLEWMNVNGSTELFQCVRYGLDYLFKEKSHLRVKYSSTHMYRFVDIVVNKYLGYNQYKQYYEKDDVVDMLNMLLAYCVGNADLYVAEHIRAKLEIVNPTEGDIKPFPRVSRTIKLFDQMLYILFLNYGVESFVEVLEYLEEKFEIGCQEYCELCFIAFDVENFAVLEWINQHWDLGVILTTECGEANATRDEQTTSYLFEQMFIKIFYKLDHRDQAFQIVCDSINSQPISNHAVVYALRSTEKHTRKLKNRGYRFEYLYWVQDTIDARLIAINENGDKINLEERVSDNDVDFWY